MALFSCVLALSFACGGEKKDDKPAKSEEKPAAGEAATGEKPAATPSEGAAAPAGNEPIICCEFGGAAGTATKSKCEASGGKVVDKSKCP